MRWRPRRAALVLALGAATVCLMPQPAVGTLPGRDGRLIYLYVGESCYTILSVVSVLPSGAGEVRLDRLIDSNRSFAWARADPAVSPDGSRLAYVSARRHLVVRELPDEAGETLRLPVVAARPAWSPDGHRLAFEGHPGGRPRSAGIYVVDRDGTGLRRLTRHRDYGPAWSSRGELAFARRDPGRLALYRMRGDGRRQRRIARVDGDSLPDWSPSGRLLAFTRAGSLFTIDRLGGSLRRLTRSGRDRSPVWSPSGRSIAFLRHGGRDDPEGLALEVMPAGGGRSRTVSATQRARVYADVLWAPAGASLFSRRPPSAAAVARAADCG